MMKRAALESDILCVKVSWRSLQLCGQWVWTSWVWQ